MASNSSTKSEKRKMLDGDLYNAMDPELASERLTARRIVREFNQTAETELDKRTVLLTSLLGSCGEEIFIEPAFRVDYGYNIHVGERFYANFNCVILDVCNVTIGNNCMLGPAVQIYTATHPVQAEERIKGAEYGRPVRIGDNSWLGGGCIINPGVTISNNVTVASGAVVTKDVPDDVVVGGNPAKIIKHLAPPPPPPLSTSSM